MDQYLFHASMLPLALYNLWVLQLSFGLLTEHRGALRWALEADDVHGFYVAVRVIFNTDS